MRRRFCFAFLWLVWLSGLTSAVRAQDSSPSPAASDFFEKRIRPLLAENCFTCHAADTNAKGGLRVDDRNGLVQGGDRGPAIAPGDAEKSLLIRAVSYQDADLQMPPNNQLSPEQVADLRQWIQDGAPWSQEQLTVEIGKSDEAYQRLRSEHWAWQPLASPAVPAVRNESWPRSGLDRFVLARLEKSGLEPVQDADAISLCRRVTFDLTGLPPRPEDIESFLSDTSYDRFEQLVDRLLSSPAFGERWGRHWLDVARYGESSGSSRNLPIRHAWRYRDYVIDAFANDKPYDQFLREQIAGDLLPADSLEEHDRQVIATGFLAIGVKDVNQRFKIRFIMDNIDEQIDTVGRAVLGLTVSCARCHDHKFDPIPTSDYYALAGIFQSTELCAGLRNKMGGGGFDFYDPQKLLYLGPEVTPDPEVTKRLDELTREASQAQEEFEALRESPDGDAPGPNGKPKRKIAKQRMVKLQKELIELSDSAAQGRPIAVGVRDGGQIGDTEIRIRGEAERLGPRVPRGFLGAVAFADRPAIDPVHSGRLELAQWLTSPKNPLTPRVMANRVWQHLFGEGLVRSVDNFGVRGDRPSHPELLDHLAGELIQNGWSVKRLVRKIVLSRAYQLSSDAAQRQMEIDPANRLFWRHSPRRLDAEEIRDAMLLVSGTLDPNRPNGSQVNELKVVEIDNNGETATHLLELASASRHRSIYLPLLRTLTPPSLQVFDFAEQGMVTGRRDTTTVPIQALYLLNDPFVVQQASAMADGLLAKVDLDIPGRIARAYRLAFGRAAKPLELDRAKAFLAEYERLAAQIPTSETNVANPESTSVEGTEEEPNSASPIKETSRPDPKTSAWISFCQALLGSAEFRYLQ